MTITTQAQPPLQHQIQTLDPDLLERIVDRRTVVGGVSAAAMAAALASLPLALGLSARRAWAQGALPQGIKDALNFALTLEYLEAAFYTQGLAAATLIPTGERPVFVQIKQHEDAHVALLTSVLGVDAVASPTFDFTAGGAFPDVFTNYQTFLALAQGFEDTGVRAYKGQAAALMSNDDILTTALRIHSVEARHASQVRRMRGQKGWISGASVDVSALAAIYVGEDVTLQAGVNTATFVNTTAATQAFDEPLTMTAVLAIADPFIV